jgi:hypothetical protein
MRFYWSEREDGSELLFAHYADDDSIAVLLPDEIHAETADELMRAFIL